MTYHVSLDQCGYSLPEKEKIWIRPDYAGIAYSDGDEVERRLADIIAAASDCSVLSRELCRHITDWPSRYHLSQLRANLLRPFAALLPGKTVLEIGAGMGALSRYLGESGAEVLALEGSPRRAAIARSRTRELANVTVICEDFSAFQLSEQFDIITLIGVLEYAPLFSTGDEPARRMLEKVRSLLKPGGQLLLAIENQLGLKYFAGAAEDHLGQPMYGLEGLYREGQPRTFGRKKLAELLTQAGFTGQEFFAPFPDYKLPVSIVSERGFAQPLFDAASLAWQSWRFDPQLPPYKNFSLELVWPEIAENGLGLDLANSFLVRAQAGELPPFASETLAWHYGGSRQSVFCKETRFAFEEEEITVHYQPFSNVPPPSSTLLSFHLADSAAYYPGIPLSYVMMRLITRDGWRVDEFTTLLRHYLDIVEKFIVSLGLPPVRIESVDTMLPGQCFDVIPQNIMSLPQGEWRVIDQEWSLRQEVLAGYMLFRAVMALTWYTTRFGRCTDQAVVSNSDLLAIAFRAIGGQLAEEQLVAYLELEAKVQSVVSGYPIPVDTDWGQHLLPDQLLHHYVIRQNDTIAQQNLRNVDQNAQVAELNAECQRLLDWSADEIYKRDVEINSITAQKNQTIDVIETHFCQAVEQIRDRDRIIDQINAERDRMLASRSWRLTAPLRSFGVRLRGLKKAITASSSLQQAQTSISNSIIRQELRQTREQLEHTPLFDAEWYLAQYADVAQVGIEPLQHYIEHGVAEGRNPNPYFDTAWYLETYPDVAAAGVNPLLHYIKYGVAEGRDPSRFFNTNYYLRHNPDVAQSGMNPLHHFLAYGQKEGRKSLAPGDTAALAIRPGESNPRRVLVADYRIPRPDVSAGELATVGILHDLCTLGFEVVFVPGNFFPDPHYEQVLSTPGLSFITSASGYLSPADYLAREGHTFGLFYFFRIDVAEAMLEIAKAASPQARIIFHAPDLHHLRETREARLERNPVKAARAKMTEEREMRIFGQSDLVVVVSPVEHQILQERLPQKKIAHFPVLYAPVSTEPTGYEKRKDMFFLGGYAHPPNVDAVLWFATEIWLLIREKLPDAMFHIIGAEAPEQLRRLGELPGIRYVGYVENLEEALATMRVGVAPLRYGAGIKGKVAATMGLGIPCVCTSIAAEGMYLHNGEQVLLADTPEDFANAVVQLYTDESLWQVISEKGRQHIDQHFGKKANTRKFISVLQQAHALPINLYIGFCKKITPDTLPASLPPDAPEVSIIIPVYNQWHFTKDCLHSVLTFCDGNQVSYEILLADDGSTDETITAAEKYPGVRVLKTEENLGFLRNCNNAARHAKGKYMLLLNNDTIVLPGWLEALYKTMEEDENIAVAGSKMLYPDGTIQEAGAVIFNDASGWNIGRGHQRYEEPFQVMRRVDYVSGCSMLIRSSVWKEVGGFDERYKNAYCEDSDFCFSARDLGYSVVYQPESEIVHFENVSYGPEAGDKKTMLMQENCKIFLEKWNPVLQSGHLSPTPDWQMAMNHADMRQGIYAISQGSEYKEKLS